MVQRSSFLFVFVCSVGGVFATSSLACSSSSSSSTSGDGGASDSAIGPYTDSSPAIVGDGGPCVMAAANTIDAGAYVPVKQQLDACTSTQINDFVKACAAATSSSSACGNFQVDSANSGCMACLVPGGSAVNSGGVLVDPAGSRIIGVNTPGCVALADPSGGPACAQALAPLFQCESAACGSADCVTAPAATYAMCLSGSEMTVCASEYSATSVCNAEYADGGAAVGACGTAAQVINRICGTGM